MSESWDFSKIIIPTYPPKSRGAISPSYLTFFQCFEAQVSSQYVTDFAPTFQGIPQEIRDVIYHLLFDETINSHQKSWYIHRRPEDAFANLQLVSRQFWKETQHYSSRLIVPANRIQKFYTQSLDVGLSPKLVVLSIEIPFNSPLRYFSELAIVLRCIGHQLEELRLYFVGKDKYGVQPIVSQACGVHQTTTLQKLGIDGQGFAERHEIFKSLGHLRKIRKLLISNAQCPLLQGMLLDSKSSLEQLHIITGKYSSQAVSHSCFSLGKHANKKLANSDPRQALHSNIPPQLRPLMLPYSQVPPVQVLHISANAAITSYQVAGRVAKTLQELTWIVPDSSLQASIMTQNWLLETSQLTDHLGRTATRLRILRICIEGAVYEGHHHYGSLMGSLTQSLPRMKLESFELHLNSKSPWFGREILEALPETLTGLHICDTAISVREIFSYFAPQYTEEIENVAQRAHGILVLEGTDYIQMGGQLKFISYEYEGHSDIDRKKMMILNGRMLDRERNRHLSTLEGMHIPPKTISGSQQPVEDDADLRSKKLYKPNYGQTQTALTQLRMSKFTDDLEYFGGEIDAEKVFASEPVAKLEDLSGLTWIDDVSVEEGDHWMS